MARERKREKEMEKYTKRKLEKERKKERKRKERERKENQSKEDQIENGLLLPRASLVLNQRVRALKRSKKITCSIQPKRKRYISRSP